TRKQMIDEALVNMTVKDYQPFTVVEDVGFREFVGILDPIYIIPSHQSLKKMVEDKHKKAKEEAKEEVKKAKADMEQTPGLEDIREKTLKIVAHFKSSTTARERLLVLKNQMGMPNNKLIQVDTLWNSTYAMLEYLFDQREPVGCELEEKEGFWSELDEVMESIPTEEEVRDRGENQVVEAEKEECCEEFRQKLRQALGGQVVLPDDWETTAEVIRETGRKVLSVSSGRRKEDKETWWWNEEVQDSIQRKRLAKKKWDIDRIEENRQEYKELQCRVKREVSKAKQKAYDELYTRLERRRRREGLVQVS
ncbi:hypothetical protein QTP86_031912, partial [Hemibagrus guttatus]